MAKIPKTHKKTYATIITVVTIEIDTITKPAQWYSNGTKYK